MSAGVPYRAPWWLPGGHAQTLYGVLFAHAEVGWRRERWDTPDGDFVDVDRLAGRADAPLVVLFHGLEGGSGSHYACAFARQLARRGWRGAVAHFRGCSGEPNRLPRAYHSGDSAEIRWIVARFAAESRGAPLFAAGVSLGGNALLKWLGEDAGAEGMLRAAAAICAPVDLMAAGDALGRGFNLVYTRAFLATMRRKAEEKLSRFPGLFDAAAMRRARTLREFDDVVTAPLHGFRDTDDYWARASAKPHLTRIRVPTLALNARNDPFVPAASLPQVGNSHVALWQPAHGGHVGFPGGIFPGHLMTLPEAVMGWLQRPAL